MPELQGAFQGHAAASSMLTDCTFLLNPCMALHQDLLAHVVACCACWVAIDPFVIGIAIKTGHGRAKAGEQRTSSSACSKLAREAEGGAVGGGEHGQQLVMQRKAQRNFGGDADDVGAVAAPQSLCCNGPARHHTVAKPLQL